MVSLRILIAIALVATSLACDDAEQCVKLSAYPADQAGGCLGSAEVIPGLEACSPVPPTRGIQMICLVDDAGQLHVATASDSARVVGTGWRYTGGVGEQQLSTSEAEQCADFSARVGLPEPAKQCAP